MTGNPLRPIVLALPLVVVVLHAVACSESSAVKEPSPDAGARVDSGLGSDGGTTTDGGDGGPKDCFDNPQTHYEIINACTNATKIQKNPTLPRLLPDGGLPALD
jgi:hypothetical protein